ncbi:ATP-binding cassette domain-containing protein [Brevibacterium album]|uniref:ATP-binding cassette domain-containing protein n=1 Tax=Brevibacterium album TaxID=417948 RepID=UPI000685BA7F|nr:ABC transporter ATP-binding protein [Brevibacterium album]
MSEHDHMSRLLDVSGLRVSFGGGEEAVRGVSLSVDQGRITALVGESGSGKSATAMSVLGLLPETTAVSGTITFVGRELSALPENRMREIRGGEIGTVFQEPMTALNPALRVGAQIVSALRGGDRDREALRARATELLEAVHIRDPELKLRQFPHELSGGQRQRVMIAMAIANRPRLLIADEPTTALDVTVQAEILQLIRELRDELDMGVLLITHDLGVVADIADRVNVMHEGAIVETGSVRDIFTAPRAPYTKKLLSNSKIGDVRAQVRREERPTPEVSRAPEASASPATREELLSFRGLSVRYPGMRARQEPIIKGIDIDVRVGETLAVVGESGSGKSTLGRALTGLLRPEFDEARLAGKRIERPRDVRGVLTTSFVFQDNASALNPRMTIGDSILAPRRFAGAERSAVSEAAAAALLEHVGLDPGWTGLFPHQLSGGQRQRVGIARAIARRPQLLIADEPTSALDVAVQKRILVLLAQLQEEMGFSCVFITHDLHLVRSFADRVVVLQGGRVQEQGEVSAVLDDPASAYTRKLLASTLEVSVDADG